MATVANIKIIVEGVYNLDYESAEKLGIKFNRTVEDFTDLSKRFGEFSLTFSLPKTKNNSQAFEFANAKGRRGIFVGTQKTCRVYNNNKLLLDGVIELRSVKSNTFQCAFFSKFSQLLDEIEDKNLKDILSLPSINDFSYEPWIISHLNAGHSPEDTFYQFPFVSYSTIWTAYSVLNGASNDFEGNPFGRKDTKYQNWYYDVSSDNSTGTNQFWFHQFPLAVYIVPILEAMLQDAGWSLGGSFFQREDIQKIVMLYTGDNDIYDQAIGCPEADIPLDACSGVTGGATDNIWSATFLPDMEQSEFLKGLMNMFNLYFTLDIDNRVIKFDTWDVLFGDKYNPYDITEFVFENKVELSRIDNYDPSIAFQDAENMRVLGDNKVMTDNQVQASNVTYAETEEDYTRKVFNKVGTTDEIDIPFGIPNVARKYLRQDIDIGGSDKSGGDFQVFLPMVTAATPQDNEGNDFFDEETDTSVFNDETTIQFNGTPTLMWYYGQSDSDFEKIGGTDNANFFYNAIGSSSVRTKMGFANPFTLLQGTELDRIDTFLAGSPIPKSKDAAEVSYLKGVHYNLGNQAGDVADVPSFSLTFGDDDTYHKTLYTEFHKNKYDLYENSELLTATMRMSEFSWNEMQINRPIKYNDELYLIISIDNYDVVKNTAKIKLIKK